jgi:hypothetical protein
MGEAVRRAHGEGGAVKVAPGSGPKILGAKFSANRIAHYRLTEIGRYCSDDWIVAHVDDI